MGKPTFGSDVEKFIEDSPRGMSKLQSGGILVGNFWGQLGLMAILTFLFWLCLFVIAGYFPYNKTINEYKAPSSCPPIPQPQIPQVEEVVVTNENAEEPLPVENLSEFNPNGPITLQGQFVFAAVIAEIKQDDETLVIVEPTESLNKIDDVSSSNNVDLPPLQDKSKSEDETDLTQIFLALNQVDAESTHNQPKYFVAPKEAQMNWFEALQACLFEKMQLVAVETEEKWGEIVNILEEELGDNAEDDDFWTSGTNLWTSERDQFYWASTGQQLNYTNWHVNNPSLADEQNCIEITKNLDASTKGTYRWNDYECHIKARFICENL